VTPIADILSQADLVENGFRTTVPADWMQGRTAYGGLTTALALHAAQRIEADLPPLRSAQVAFVGPLAGAVTITAQRLRRGRNATYIDTEVRSEAGLGLRATFLFMAPLPSAVTHDAMSRAERHPPEPNVKTYIGPDEFFTGNFEFHDVKVPGAAEWLRWARLRGRDGLDPAVELLAIADGLPPAAFKLFDKQVPLSSLTWHVNLLTTDLSTQDGWWLLQAATDRAVDGFSSQRMRIWNAAGAPVVDAMQSVAIFA